jgi:hypothetical protein
MGIWREFVRTGLGKFAKTVHILCRLFGTFRGSIKGAINASQLDSSDKDKLLALVDTIDTACAAVDLIMVKYEQ